MASIEGIQVPAKLFVSRFPPECLEDELRRVFEPFGEIVELIILKKDKKKSAFVRYADVDYCDAAIRGLHGQKMMLGAEGPLKVQFASGEIERLQIKVDYSYLPDPDGKDINGGPMVSSLGTGEIKLFVGALPKKSDEDVVQHLFSGFGDITEIYIIKDKQGKPTGSAFVKFAQPQAAQAAMENLHGTSPLDEQTRPLEVRQADADGKSSKKAMAPPTSAVYGRPPPSGKFAGPPPPPPSQQPMYGRLARGQPPPPPATNYSPNNGDGIYKLFVGALPGGYSEKEVGELFSQFGRLVDVHLMRDGGGKSKGAAFVKFASFDGARVAIDNLDKRITLPGVSRPVEVRFAEDPGKGKGNGHGGKGGARYSPY